MVVPVPAPKIGSGMGPSGLRSGKNGLGPDQTELPQHYDEEEKPDIIVKNGQVYAAVKHTDDKKSKKGHVDPKKQLLFDGVNIPQ